MAETPTVARLRGLIMSAVELREKHPEWDDSFTEDYLSLIENFVLLADEVDKKNNINKTTTFVNTTPYMILDTDEEIFYNTNIGPIVATLPVGDDGRNFRHINVGNIGENVTLTPNGTELLFGANETEYIADEEVLITTFATDVGWY